MASAARSKPASAMAAARPAGVDDDNQPGTAPDRNPQRRPAHQRRHLAMAAGLAPDRIRWDQWQRLGRARRARRAGRGRYRAAAGPHGPRVAALFSTCWPPPRRCVGRATWTRSRSNCARRSNALKGLGTVIDVEKPAPRGHRLGQRDRRSARSRYRRLLAEVTATLSGVSRPKDDLPVSRSGATRRTSLGRRGARQNLHGGSRRARRRNRESATSRSRSRATCLQWIFRDDGEFDESATRPSQPHVRPQVRRPATATAPRTRRLQLAVPLFTGGVTS